MILNISQYTISHVSADVWCVAQWARLKSAAHIHYSAIPDMVSGLTMGGAELKSGHSLELPGAQARPGQLD